MSRNMRRNFPLIVLAMIAIVLFGIFYLAPMFYLLRTSFWQYAPNAVGARGFMIPAFTFDNFQTALTGTYLHYVILTLRVGIVCTVVAVLLSYPVAYFIARWSGHAKLKKILLITLIASFLVGSLARVFAWYSMLTGQGFVNALLSVVGFPRTRFIGTELAIDICQIQYLMSIATLSLVSPLKNVDLRLEEASKSLGAEEIHTFLNVTLPLSLPGIVAASLLCFAITVSAYVTPLVLGAGGVLMVSNLVTVAFLQVSNYPLGAAFSVILLLASLVSMYLLEKALVSRVRT